VSLIPAPPRTRELLETDRIWSAYALADLEPEEQGRAEWHTGANAVVLLYRGLEPPVLFIHGDPNEGARLAEGLGSMQVVYTLRPECLRALGDRLTVEQQTLMWRMALEPGHQPGASEAGAIPLGTADLGRLTALFGDHPDRPDAFHPRQLESGVFFGMYEGEELVGVAGTHILGPGSGVAAIGNVFTHPGHRGRGVARRATSAVVSELLRRGYAELVMNVGQSNEPALRCYRGLGFTEYCAYHEGVGRLNPTLDRREDSHG
jgi:ribosomal protein S18 acetylase RimI-like enzyme